MRLKISFESEKRERILEVPRGKKIHYILQKLEINPQKVIVLKNNQVVSEHEPLQEKDTIKIITVKANAGF